MTDTSPIGRLADDGGTGMETEMVNQEVPLQPLHLDRRLTHKPRPRTAPRWWLAVLVLAMLVASEYKLRLRPPAATLRGDLDLQIAVELGVYGLAALFLLAMFGYPRRQRPPAVLLTAGYFSVVMLASTLWAVYPVTAFTRGCQLVIVAALAWAIYHHGRRDQLHLLVHAYIGLVAVSVVVGVVHPYPRGALVQDRFNWLYVHPVTAGSYLGLAVVLLLALLLGRVPGHRQPVRWPRWLYLALLAGTVAALVATRTRGAIGGCLVGCAVVVFSARRRLPRRDLFGVAVLGVLLVLILVGSDLVDFVLRGEGTARLETFNGRLDLWQEAIGLVQRRPLLGYGLTASRGLFLDSTGLGGAHNALVNVLVDGGLIGAACWLALLATVFGSLWRLPQTPAVTTDRPLLLGSMIFLVVNSVTMEGLSVPANVSSIWLYVVVGWLGVLLRAVPVERGAGREATMTP
jgi:exopolysaccharide production protein ExoQ